MLFLLRKPSVNLIDQQVIFAIELKSWIALQQVKQPSICEYNTYLTDIV